MEKAIYKKELKTIDGKPTSLAAYKNQVLLLVNVASQCGLTPQYEELGSLYKRYHDRGFEFSGFHQTIFGAQEPGSNAEIADFCQSKYGVKFPMFEKIAVNGPERHPLYTELIQSQPSRIKSDADKLEGALAQHGLAPKTPSDVLWNFEKFLINRNGDVVARFAPDVTPDDPKIAKAIEALL